MLHWAKHFFGKASTSAAAATDASDGGTGEAVVRQEQPRRSRRGADVPPLKRWWISADAEDAPAGAARPSPPASLTLAEAGMDGDYGSPGILDLAASLNFGASAPAAAAAAAEAPATEVVSARCADLTTTSTAHAHDNDDDDDAVDDFLRNVIAGKTDMLRKRLAQEKLEAAAAAAAAAANPGHHNNNSPSCTSDGAASMGSSMHMQKSITTATTTTGAALAAGGASPQHYHARRSRYVSSAARSLQDYELIAFLGSGTFAEVTLARNKVTGEYFAVKKISKQRVKEEGCVERTFTERQLLAKLHHTFLVRLYQAFQSQTHLYLVLDFAQGGDLYSLNVQQLWLRSMKRNLVKMQYPYYQSTSRTFTPAPPPAAATSNAQQHQPRASPVSARADGAQRTAGPALPRLPSSATVTQPTEVVPDVQRQQPRGSSGTATSDRDAILASSAMVGSVGPSTVSSASRPGNTVANTATGAALPLPSARDGRASGVADGAHEAAAAVAVEEEMKEEDAKTTEFDGATDNHHSMAEAPQSAVLQRQRQSIRHAQPGAADCPSQHPRLETDLFYYTTDAIDEFSTSRNVGSGGSRSSPTTPTISRTPEATESATTNAAAAAGDSAPAATRDGEVASSTASVASSGRERYRLLRRRTLPAVERDSGARGGLSVSSSSSSSTADDNSKGRRRRDTADKDGRGSSADSARRLSWRPRGVACTGPATQAEAASQHPPSPAASTPSRQTAASSASGVSTATSNTALPLATRPSDLTTTDLATPKTQVPLPRSPVHFQCDERSSSSGHSNNGGGGVDEALRDDESSSAVSVKSTPSLTATKWRPMPRRASASELTDIFAVAASSAAVTVSATSAAGGTSAADVKRYKTTKSAWPPATGAEQPQLASDNSHTATSATSAAATSLPRRQKGKAKVVSDKDEGSGASPPLHAGSRHSHRRAPAKKATESHDASEAAADQRSLSTDITTDAAKPLSATVTTMSFVGATAVQDAAATTAALRVDLAAPFHQVAMEGSASVLRTLPSTVFAPDGAHRLPLRLIAFYAIEVALVLQYLHREGFLYRDLKPENILMCRDGHVMLTDFGVAKYRKGAAIMPSGSGEGVQGEVASSPSSSAGACTYGRANSFTGTTQYMSPEMLRGQPHDSRTDWWSYGCLLFEWANGRKAFNTQNQFALFRSIVEEDVKITAEDYRLTLLEVHTRVAQLHYRAEEVRLAYEQRVARRMRRSFTPLSQSTRPQATPSALTAEVVYNPDNRSFDVQLRSPAMSALSFAQSGSNGAGAAAEGAEEALTGNAVKSCIPHPKDSRQLPPPLLPPSNAAATHITPHRHAHRRLHSYSYASPHSTATVPKASVAVLLNDSFANQLGALGVSRTTSAEEDTQGPSPQSTLNDSFAGVESNSVVSLCGAPTNLSMRLTTTEDGVIAALLSSASSTAVHLQHQQQQQERHRRHQRRRLRLSCLNLDEATRDRYIDNAVAQMAEAQALLRDLTMKLLDRRMEHRLSGEAVLEHPFFTCPYIVSQLYYDVYQRRVLSTEMRRSVRAAFGSNNVPVDLVAPVWDGTLQQPTTVASPLPPLVPASPTPFATTTTAAAAAAASVSHTHDSSLAIPLPSQTRPEDWRKLFMERHIRAPYTPRLRTRDDLRYFPAAVTATGLSAAVEQHRRIKEVKEQQKELMIMRANKATATAANNSFGSATFPATLSCPNTQLPANGSGSGGGSVVLVPLDAEAAQQVQQLLVASASSLSLHNRDDASPLPELDPDGAAAVHTDGVRAALDVSHAAAAPVALTSSGAAVAVSTPAASSQGLTEKIQRLQLPAVEVIGAVTADLGAASPSHKQLAEVTAQSSATGDARRSDLAEEAQLDTAATTAAVELPSRMWEPQLAGHCSAGTGSAKASPMDTALSVGSGSVMTSAAAAEFRPNLLDRAATLPQSFVDAALAVAAAAAQKQQQRPADSGTAPKALIAAPVETQCSRTGAVAAAETACASASTDVIRSTGAARSTFAATPPTSPEALPQQEPARVDGAAPNSCVLPAFREMAYAADGRADGRRSGALPACGGVGAHSTADAEAVVEDAEKAHAEVLVDEGEDHDGGGGYYEQDALAEDDAHAVDGGDDSTIVEETAAAVDMTSETDAITAAAVNSTMEVSSFEDSHASVRLPTPTRRGTLVKSSVVVSSAGTSGWGSSAANPLSPGVGSVDAEADSNNSVCRRGNVSITGPPPIVPMEVPPTANASPDLRSHSRRSLGSGSARPMHGPLKEAPVYASPLLSHSGEMHCDLSAFTMSPVSSMTTMLLEDSQRSLSTSLGPSGAGGPCGTSSAWATPSSADTQVPEREYQRRVYHHRHPLSYTDGSGNQAVPGVSPHMLPLPPSLAHCDESQQQPPEKLLSAATSFENALLPATTSFSSTTNTTPLGTIMMIQSAELTGVGRSLSAATTAAGTASDAAPSCTASPAALQALAAFRDGTTTVGGVEASSESPCGGELHSAGAARSGGPPIPAAFSAVEHRGARPSSATAAAVTGMASMNVNHGVADDDDNHDVGIANEAGYERSGGEEHSSGDDDGSDTMTNSGSASEGQDEGDWKSDASESVDFARRPTPSAPASARGENVAGSERSAGAVSSLLDSSASSISTTTSTSVHALSVSSDASSTSLQGDNNRTAAMYPTAIRPPMALLAGADRGGDGDPSGTISERPQRGDTVSLSPYDTPWSFDARIGSCSGGGDHCRRGSDQCMLHRYAHLGCDAAHGGVGTSMPFTTTVTSVAVNPTMYATLSANTPLSVGSSSSRFFSAAGGSSLSLDTIGGGADDAAGFWGPLTTTLSGVAYNIDDEASMSTFAAAPMMPAEGSDSDSGAASTPLSGYGGRGQGGKDAIGATASSGAGSPSAAGRRRGVQAIWAKQQRKRIARELQQQQQQRQQELDPSAAASLLCEAGAESGRRGISDSGRWWSYRSKHSSNDATISSKGNLVDLTSNDGCAEPQHRRMHLGVPYDRSIGDDDKYNAAAAGRCGSPLQRQSCSVKSGGEQGRSDGRGGKRDHQNSALKSSGNEGGADGRAGATGEGGSGGFDHFQNFSFTSPQLLQHCLASSSSSSGGGGGDVDEGRRRPHYQRLRRGRLGGGDSDREP
ncbi:putative serine/threonine-protein kinase [Leishmania major strain Friedlin]|uniref:non-specific serine/threonine protein kinase n=1 Tax=Leishmania major TaxID=5664 RepID=E9ACM3_LEIMA|nr:putative serine/threonine-protein kinase [Leishmania major strain Friedlin]CAG9567304.1 AGC/RSK_family_serine/threonine_kinase_putative [Leishmania major strain Friedlin]CBZ12040.1 putative serine/threonine-protein kinase [Leishmania major strain Friedlin]|eukprot:XP_003721754.1 putative serine/threonine-protein kinase [Leishmania major strain Friedlin]